jgi:hypothetical protein
MKTTIKLGLAAATLTLVAGGVLAATTTNSPGAACVAATGTLTVLSSGETENATGSTVTAVCPAERPVGANGTSKVSGNVWVVDQNPSYNVCCKVVSKNAGGAVVESPLVCSSGSSSSYQILSLAEITDGYTYSHYFVQCTVPPVNGAAASRIQMYRTTQQ